MSVASLYDKRPSIAHLEVLPKASLYATDSSPRDGSPVLPPSEAHIQETSPRISGYLDFIPQQNCTPPTTPSTTLASTAVSRKTSTDNLTAIDATFPPPPNAHTLERFPLRISSAFFVYFLCGWGDGVTGTVLPRFTQEMRISHTESSLFFVAGTGGYFLGTLILEPLLSFLGRFNFSLNLWQVFYAFQSKVSLRAPDVARSTVLPSPSQARVRLLVLGGIFHALFFVILGSEPRFATALVAFAVAAFARALLTGSLNDYVNSHPKKSLGQLHGFWAIGAFFSPLICQSLMSKGIPWRNFYLGSLVLSAMNTAFIAFAFAPTPSEISIDRVQVEHKSNAVLPSPIGSKPSAPTHGRSTLRLAFSMPLIWAFSVFQAIYAGGETVTQGFIVVYLLSERAANPRTVGYVSSGFWAGMSISRIGIGFLYPHLSFRRVKNLLQLNLLLFVSAQSDYRLSILICSAPAKPVIALVMHILVWVVPSLGVDAVCTSIIGLVYGPIFPIGIALVTQLLPPELHMISMAINSAFGSIGNAIFPFLTGILANDVGVKTYSYILVAQGIGLVVLWAILPSKKKEETLE